MKNLNRWQGIGRLGQDPEIRYLPNGTAVCSISIACQDDYKDKDGNKHEQTEWVRLSAFARQAEVMGEYLSKGSKIYAEGKLVTRKWQDSQGQDRYTTEVRISSFEMLDSKGEKGDVQKPAKNQAEKPAGTSPDGYPDSFEDGFDDDIPF